MNVKDHYDNYLGYFYSWMIGDFEEMRLKQELFFRDNNVFPLCDAGIALDLGSGHGLQSISLAKLGFSVKSVDFNKQLLNELKERSSLLSIEVIEHNILSFLKGYAKRVELIVCMGDTLTRLENKDQVEMLIENSANILMPHGKIILSFRALTLELKGNNVLFRC